MVESSLVLLLCDADFQAEGQITLSDIPDSLEVCCEKSI